MYERESVLRGEQAKGVGDGGAELSSVLGEVSADGGFEEREGVLDGVGLRRGGREEDDGDACFANGVEDIGGLGVDVEVVQQEQLTGAERGN